METDIQTVSSNPVELMSFHGEDNEIIGAFYWNDGELEFEGDAKESAKVFIEWLKETWNLNED